MIHPRYSRRNIFKRVCNPFCRIVFIDVRVERKSDVLSGTVFKHNNFFSVEKAQTLAAPFFIGGPFSTVARDRDGVTCGGVSVSRIPRTFYQDEFGDGGGWPVAPVEGFGAENGSVRQPRLSLFVRFFNRLFHNFNLSQPGAH